MTGDQFDAKIDLAGPDQRGLAVGIDEAFGYTGVAAGAWITGVIAGRTSLRPEPFYFLAVVVVLATLISIFLIRETVRYARSDGDGDHHDATLPFLAVLKRATYGDRTPFAAAQAGHGAVDPTGDGRLNCVGLPFDRPVETSHNRTLCRPLLSARSRENLFDSARPIAYYDRVMTDDSLTFRDMYRANPVEGAMFTIVPALLALVQLTNSFVTDLSFFVSVPFALVVVGYAWVLNQHSFAQFRRRHLEGRV